MKRNIFYRNFGLFIVIISFLFIVGYAEPAPPTLVIKGVTFAPLGDPSSYVFEQFIKRINEVGKGKLRIDLLGGPEVIPMLEQPATLRKGVVDLVSNAPTFWLGMIPSAFADEIVIGTAAQRRETGWLKYLDNMFRKELGITALGYVTITTHGFITLTNAPEMAKTLDWSPYKVLTSPSMIPAIRSLGGIPLSLPLTEHYVAMQKGIAPALNAVLFAVAGRSFWEVSKYYILPCFPLQATTLYYMRAEFWDQLPSEIKKIIMDVILEFEPMAVEWYYERESENLRLMDKNGMKRLEMTKSLADEFTRKTLQGTWQEMIVQKVTSERKAELIKTMRPLVKAPLE